MELVNKETLDEIALTLSEYQLIVETLGRVPNELELGMFGALWSEHCGYQHSKPLLRLLPSKGDRVLFPHGQENAGAVNIGDGLAIVFKIESHNHPSAIEPFQGAATGVGGIVRDILALGARPMALLNSLRFGPLDDPHNRYLFKGVVGGISWYGNCIGVPDVGGEIAFDSGYAGNPLVNVLCVGLVQIDKLAKSTVGDEGNLIILIGSETGRDGIHGASGLASRTFELQEGMRPAVQVGNPFLEKVLIEACIEAVASGIVVGVQDLGAAGLTSSVVESVYKSGKGVLIDVSKVHLRERNMSAYEIMLSESQERMILVIKPENKRRLVDLLHKWDLPWSEIGKVTSDGRIKVYDGKQKTADLPVKVLNEPKLYRLKGHLSAEVKKARSFPLSSIPLPSSSPEVILRGLLESCNINNKEQVYRQYDSQVQTNTVIAPGVADAAVLRIKGTRKAVAISTDGNANYCYLDPYRGGMIAVAEACRNVSCVGAQPIALTDCLNFGDPTRPEVYFALEWTIKGIAKACRVFNVPVVSGNVSLYNETRGKAILPTPVIGALGYMEDVDCRTTLGFKRDGDAVLMIGCSRVHGTVNSMAASEYLVLYHNMLVGRPEIDLQMEARVQALCRTAVGDGIISSAHDVSNGGLAVAIAESCLVGELGFVGDFTTSGRWDAALFGEVQSRIIVSVPPLMVDRLQELAAHTYVPLVYLGLVGGERLIIKGLIDLSLEQLEESWRNGFN